jgi:hypothetical protein
VAARDRMQITGLSTSRVAHILSPFSLSPHLSHVRSVKAVSPASAW